MDIDIRPVAVDRLVEMSPAGVESRKTRIEELLTRLETQCIKLRGELKIAEDTTAFLHRELAGVQLALKLQRGEVVRVVCPGCKGSGMKPTDTTGGQIRRRSAFESVGPSVQPQSSLAEIPVADRCLECEGKRWVLMDRFIG